MPGTFDVWTVLFSFTVASLAGFVSFEAVEHTRFARRPKAWTLVSGLTLGLGIWSMHFIGMLAWQPPFPLYYAKLPTALSVVAAVVSSWLAMHLVVTTKPEQAERDLMLGAVAVGGGISAMHYIGMDALKFSQPLMWNWPGVALSFVIAVLASLGAMAMLLGSNSDTFTLGRQVLASLVIAVAICGMHYTGMMAMMVPHGAISLHLPGYFAGASLARLGVGNSLVFMACLLVVFHRDKVRLMQAASEARMHQHEAERTVQRLGAAGKIAASIAHEINNPLEAVTNLLYLTERGEVGTQEREYLKQAQAELQRIAEITTHTLKFYRQQSGPALTSLTDLMESTVAVFAKRLETNNIQVQREWNLTTPPVMCRAGEIRQVFANLVSNAIDAMTTGGTLTLIVQPGQGGGGEIIVRDTGAGMSPEVQQRVMEPFYTTKGASGTGLGLSICAEIVQRHGGSLTFESSTEAGNSGTSFRMMLPARMTETSSA